MANSDFEGFANAPVDEDGELVDFRDVPAYDDQSEAGLVRDASQTTPSSIAEFKTEGTSTNGFPAAVVVPKDRPELPDFEEVEDATDEDELGVDADPAEPDEKANTQDAPAAGGEEGSDPVD